MKIETKKNIGDIIFFLKDMKIISAPIEDVNVAWKGTKLASLEKGKIIQDFTVTISYMVRIENKDSYAGYDFKTVSESEAFDSREQLIESL
jgi:hypothetical protein